jgi:hypothetical protein
MERKQRAFSEPIYLLNMEPVVKEDVRIFNVLGTTGNKYIVTVGEKISCTCLDYVTRGKICKHIYFVLCRICKCEKFRINMTRDKRIKIFSNIPSFIDYNLLTSFDELTLKVTEKIGTVEQKIDDVCPICLEDLSEKEKYLLDYCKYGCGKSYHILCFEMCTKSLAPKICAFCRHKL